MDPVTQVQVENTIRELDSLLERAMHQIRKRALEAGEADAAFKVCHAKAFLLADGPVSEREATALLACEMEYVQRKASEAVLLSAQEAGRNLRARMEGQRSLAANLRPLVVGS